MTTLFSGAISLPGGVANSAAIQSDNKIVMAGTLFNGTDHDFALARYNTDGTLDTSFGTSGKVVTPVQVATDDNVGAIAVQANGAILVGGDSNAQLAVVRYTSAGALDTSFGVNGVAIVPLGSTVNVRDVSADPSKLYRPTTKPPTVVSTPATT